MSGSVPSRRALYLLADSQLLFRPTFEGSLFGRLRAERPKSAAYLGASNGDEPAYYDIFDQAMRSIGVEERGFVRSDASKEDTALLERADLIVLAGGDVLRGFRRFVATGWKDVIVRRYLEGAVLVGVSAGAVQLGWGARLATESGGREAFFPTFRLVPFLIGAHEERDGWRGLRAAAREVPEAVPAMGIPFGGGMIVHPDHTVEAVRFPLYEFRCQNGVLAESLCMPPEESVKSTTGGIDG